MSQVANNLLFGRRLKRAVLVFLFSFMVGPAMGAVVSLVLVVLFFPLYLGSFNPEFAVKGIAILPFILIVWLPIVYFTCFAQAAICSIGFALAQLFLDRIPFLLASITSVLISYLGVKLLNGQVDSRIDAPNAIFFASHFIPAMLVWYIVNSFWERPST